MADRIADGPSGPGVLASALWLGLVVGLVELGLLSARMQWAPMAMTGALKLNRHYPWMIPSAHLAMFGGVGLVLELVARAWPRAGRGWVVRVLGGLTALAVLLPIRELSPVAAALLAAGIGLRVAPMLADRFAPVFAKAVRFGLPALIVGLVLLIVGRYSRFAMLEKQAKERPSAAAGSPNVLLIVLDTVRARSLGLYGYGRDTSPRLAGLAKRGVAFEMARSTAPWTLPSHASLFTGRWPHELFDHPEGKMAAGAPSLAEFLAGHGYATSGFVANTYYCNAGFGLARGFDRYEDFAEIAHASPAEILRHSGMGRKLIELVGDAADPPPEGRKDADRINADFLGWLNAKPEGRPFFAFLNYFDAHDPYFPPAGARRRFGATPTPEQATTLANWHSRTNGEAAPADIALARDAYDDCIASLDEALGRLFDELDRRGELARTVVIVTADHGEELGEHKLFGHGRSLYDEELHVPLIVVAPGRAPEGRRVAEPVSLRDVPATVADLLGLAGASPFPGLSLATTWADGRSAGPGDVFSEVALRDKLSRNADRPPAQRGPMTAVVADGSSYIRNADGREELYDLLADPGESRDLATGKAIGPILGRLRERADRIKRRSRQGMGN